MHICVEGTETEDRLSEWVRYALAQTHTHTYSITYITTQAEITFHFFCVVQVSDKIVNCNVKNNIHNIITFSRTFKNLFKLLMYQEKQSTQKKTKQKSFAICRENFAFLFI